MGQSQRGKVDGRVEVTEDEEKEVSSYLMNLRESVGYFKSNKGGT